MMGLELFVTIVVTAVAATAALYTKLGKIEAAVGAHVASDAEVHKDLGARIIKLEGRRGRR